MDEPKQRNWWKIGCLGFLGFVLVGGILSAIAGDPPTDGTDVQSGPSDQIPAAVQEDDGAEVEAAPATPQNKPGISASEFAQLRAGMSYPEVVAIIGSEGELISENEMAGYRTQMFMWDEEGTFGIGNANVMFQNGQMIQKSQFGLD